MAPSSAGALRTVLAFLAAPLAGAAVIVAIYLVAMLYPGASDAGGGTSAIELMRVFLVLMAYALPLALLTTIIFGIPAFLLLGRIGRLTAPWTALAGGVVASAPLTLFLFSGTTTLFVSVPPAALVYPALLFVGGAVGGWVFWRVRSRG